MSIILLIIEIIIGLLLVGTILLQMQGNGLSSSFGGAGEFYRSKRSIEKLLIAATGILAVLFAVFSVLLILQK